MHARVALVALAAGVVVACSSGVTPPTGNQQPGDSILGTWALATVNGRALPAADNTGTTWTSSRVTLTNDGRYTSVFSHRAPGSQTTVTENGAGTWVLRGDRLEYNGSAVDGIVTFAQTTLTQVNGSTTYVYRRP
jgi:hypothetical protein